MTQRIPLTTTGAKKLREELEQLKSVERPKVIEAISEARAHGDLKENAEYHAARERQSFLEGRIIDLEAKLSNCQIIDISTLPNDGRVVFGATMTLLDIEDEAGKAVTYQIVGMDEADIKAGKISFSSPIAKAAIGKEVGDEIIVQTPEGEKYMEILKVELI